MRLDARVLDLDEQQDPRNVLVEVVESLGSNRDAELRRLVGSRFTVVVTDATEILWIGDADWRVGGLIDVVPKGGEMVQDGGHVIAELIQLHNPAGEAEIFRP